MPSSAVPRSAYVLDRPHSSVEFAIRHNGVSTFKGQFERVDAQLVDGVLSGSADVESVKTAIPDLFPVLASAAFFNVAEAPTATFRSTVIRTGADGSTEVEGELTIRGVTHPVTASGTFASGDGLHGPVAGFDLTASIDRRHFGLEWQAPLPSGGESLGWSVTLEAHLQLTAAEE